MTEETLAGGLRLGTVLILEDEAMVSLLIEDIVRDLGAETVHLFGDAHEAREAASTASLDCAILDVMVRGGTSHEIADILDGRGVPFIFSTGSGDDGIPQHHRHRPVVAKPFADDDLRKGLAVALGQASRALARRTDAGSQNRCDGNSSSSIGCPMTSNSLNFACKD